MFTWWPSLVMGWPAIGAAAICSILAIAAKKPRLMTTAGIIAIPFSLYALPFAPIVLGCYFGASYALRRKRVSLASALVLPVLAIYGMLAYRVLTQPDPSRSPHAVRWHSEGVIQKP